MPTIKELEARVAELEAEVAQHEARFAEAYAENTALENERERLQALVNAFDEKEAMIQRMKRDGYTDEDIERVRS